MAQVTTGLKAILSLPLIYETFQKLMGATRYRRQFVANFIAPFNVKTILDIGCGPAGLLAYLTDVTYFGYDINQSYIDSAKSQYGDRGHFFAKQFTEAELISLPKFDLIIMHGLLHHLEDAQATELLHIAYQALKKGGRVITADGCLVKGQNSLAKWLIKHDRGLNIKNEVGYKNLVPAEFSKIETVIEHHKWVPYTLCYLHCTR